MNVEKLRHKLDVDLSNATNVSDYANIVHKFLHIMDDMQIERVLIEINELATKGSDGQYFAIGAIVERLSPYIKSKWLKYIPDAIAQHCPSIILRTMPYYRKKLPYWLKKVGINQFLDYAIARPSLTAPGSCAMHPRQMYKCIKRKWLSELKEDDYDVRNYDDAAKTYAVRYDPLDLILKYKHAEIDKIFRLMRCGYINAWSTKQAIEVINMISSNAAYYHGVRVLRKSLIGLDALCTAGHFHYRILESLLNDIIAAFDTPFETADLCIARKKATRRIDRLRALLRYGSLCARISSEMKIRLALIFENLPTNRILSKEEYERLMHERAIRAIKEM